MDIPVDAEVQCTDGPAGRSICVLLDPVGERITHVVVEEKDFPNTERMVPVEWVTESTPDQLMLKCTREEFSALTPFVRTEFVVADGPYGEYDEDHYLRWPYIRLADEMRGVEYERIPPGELGGWPGRRISTPITRVSASTSSAITLTSMSASSATRCASCGSCAPSTS